VHFTRKPAIEHETKFEDEAPEAASYLLRQQQERTLRKGDRVALLGRGIAVVEQADEKEAVVVLGSGEAFMIARKDIVPSQRNLRWEYRISS